MRPSTAEYASIDAAGHAIQEGLYASIKSRLSKTKLDPLRRTAVKEFQCANSGLYRIRRQNGVRDLVVVTVCFAQDLSC